MLTFLTWFWTPHLPTERYQFTAAHVNTLFAMVDRHYPGPHRNICVTNLPKGIHSSIEIVADEKHWADVPNPSGRHNPSCYRRLRMYRPDAAQWFGERMVSLDLDTVIVGDLTPLFAGNEDFRIWGQCDRLSRGWYNGSLVMLKAGARPQVWERFNPKRSPYEAKKARSAGSDQGWIGHCLGRKEATWSTADGVYSYRVHLQPKGAALPADARVVSFHGKWKPWSPEVARLPWVREHWRSEVPCLQ